MNWKIGKIHGECFWHKMEINWQICESILKAFFGAILLSIWAKMCISNCAIWPNEWKWMNEGGRGGRNCSWLAWTSCPPPSSVPFCLISRLGGSKLGLHSGGGGLWSSAEFVALLLAISAQCPPLHSSFWAQISCTQIWRIELSISRGGGGMDEGINNELECSQGMDLMGKWILIWRNF